MQGRNHYWLRLIGGAVVLASIALSPAASTAHTGKTSGDIEGLLHVGSNDQSMAGQPTSLSFIMSYKDQEFDLSDCECRLIIRKGNDRIFNGAAQLISGSGTLKTTFTFPRAGVYNLELLGRPRTAQAFAPFEIEYTLRVKPAAAPSGADRLHTMAYGLLGLGAVAVIWCIGRDIITGKHSDGRTGK